MKRNMKKIRSVAFIIMCLFLFNSIPIKFVFANISNIADLSFNINTDKGNIVKGEKGIDYTLSYIDMTFDQSFGIVSDKKDYIKISAYVGGKEVNENYKFDINADVNGTLSFTLKNDPSTKAYYQLRKHTLYNIFIPEGALKNSSGKLNKEANYTFVTKGDSNGAYKDDILVKTEPFNQEKWVSKEKNKIVFEFIDDIEFVDDFLANIGNYIEIDTEPMDILIPSYQIPPSYQFKDSIANYDVSKQGNKLILTAKAGMLKDMAKYTVKLKNNALYLRNSKDVKIYNQEESNNDSEIITFYTDNMLTRTYPSNNQENVEVEPTIEFEFKYPLEILDKNKVKITSNGLDFNLDEDDIYLTKKPGKEDKTLLLNINDHEKDKIYPLRRHTVYKVTIEDGAVRFKDYSDSSDGGMKPIVNKEINLYFITRGDGEMPVPIEYFSNTTSKDDIRYLDYNDTPLPGDKKTDLGKDGSIYIKFDRDIREDKQSEILSLIGATRLYKMPKADATNYDPSGKLYDETISYYKKKNIVIPSTIPYKDINSIILDKLEEQEKDFLIHDIMENEKTYLEEIPVLKVEIVDSDTLKITPKYSLEYLNKYKLTVDKRVIEDLNRYNMEKNIDVNFWTKPNNQEIKATWKDPRKNNAEGIKENEQGPYHKYISVGKTDTLYGIPQNKGDVKSAKVDMVFVLDKSGSMASHKDILMKNIESFVNSLKASGLNDVRMGLVSYDDKAKKVEFGGDKWTTDATQIQTEIGKIPTSGGNENLLSALDFVVKEYDFRDNNPPSHSKHIIFLTDEDADDKSLLSGTATILDKKQIKVTGIDGARYGKGDNGEKVNNKLLETTDGNKLSLEDENWGKQLVDEVSDYIVYWANPKAVVLDIDKEVIPNINDKIFEQTPNDSKNLRRINYNSLNNISLLDVYNENSDYKYVNFEKYEFYYYYEDGVKKTKLHLYPNKPLKNGTYYQLKIPSQALVTRSRTPVPSMEVNFVIEGDSDKGNSAYQVKDNEAKVTDIWQKGEWKFMINGYNFHEDIKEIKLTLEPKNASDTTPTIAPIIIGKEDIEFRSVTEIWGKIRGENAKKFSKEEYVGKYKIEIIYEDGEKANIPIPLYFTLVSKGRPTVLAYYPQANSSGKWYDENELLHDIDDSITQGRKFLKVTFEDIDGKLKFNDTDGINNLLNSVVNVGSANNNLDIDFLNIISGNQEYISKYIFTKDRSKREAYLYIPVKNIIPQSTYNIDIKEGVVQNDSIQMDNDKIYWKFTTMANPDVIDKDVIIKTVGEEYDEDEPLIIYGNFFYGTPDVYFNKIQAEAVKPEVDSQGKTYLKVYLPDKSDRLEPGLYNIIIENDNNHTKTLYGALSVVKQGEYIPNEKYKVKDDTSKGEIREDIKVSENTLMLKSKYADESELEFDLDDLMGEDVLVRSIKYEGDKNDTISELITKSKWADITIYGLTAQDYSEDEVTVNLGRVEPSVIQSIQRKLVNVSVKSEFIQVTGENFGISSISVSIPYKNSDGRNLKILRYDEEMRNWYTADINVDFINKKAITISKKPGIFAVVE